ncbi:MAG: hypothetical protein ACI30X_04720 [Muribaculaceae bacterium]
MAEIIVTIDNTRALDSIINAIKMLRGVTSAKVWKSDSPKVTTTKKYSPKIENLRKLCGTGITQEDIAGDERLAYLLSK